LRDWTTCSKAAASLGLIGTREYGRDEEELAKVQQWFERFEPVPPGVVGVAA